MHTLCHRRIQDALRARVAARKAKIEAERLRRIEFNATTKARVDAYRISSTAALRRSVAQGDAVRVAEILHDDAVQRASVRHKREEVSYPH